MRFRKPDSVEVGLPPVNRNLHASSGVMMPLAASRTAATKPDSPFAGGLVPRCNADTVPLWSIVGTGARFRPMAVLCSQSTAIPYTGCLAQLRLRGYRQEHLLSHEADDPCDRTTISLLINRCDRYSRIALTYTKVN